MASSPDFSYLLGNSIWQTPAEIRVLEGEPRTAKRVDLDEFQRQVEEKILVLQSIAEERLEDRENLLAIVLSDPPNKAERQSINFDALRDFDRSQNVQSYNQAVDDTRKLLERRLDEKSIKIIAKLSGNSSDSVIREEGARIASEVAQEAYSTELIVKTSTFWKAIRESCCPSLKLVSDDAFEIAKAIAPILVPLSLAGTIAVPVQPMLFAWIGLVIARLGVKNICEDCSKNLLKGEAKVMTDKEGSRIINVRGNYIESNTGIYVQGNYINMSQNLSQAAPQIQDLLEQLQARGVSTNFAQEEIAKDIAAQAVSNPTMKTKLLNWGQSLGDATVSDVVKGIVKLAIRSAGIPLP